MNQASQLSIIIYIPRLDTPDILSSHLNYCLKTQRCYEYIGKSLEPTTHSQNLQPFTIE